MKPSISLLAATAMAYYPGGGFSHFRPDFDTPAPRRPRRYRPGPCRECGKPNVKLGREKGIYLCSECHSPATTP